MMGAFDFRVDGERRGTWNEVAEMISNASIFRDSGVAENATL